MPDDTRESRSGQNGFGLIAVVLAAASLGAASCRKPEASTGPVPSDAPPPSGPVTTRVTGEAQNAKLGAVVISSDRGAIYCGGLEAWPNEVIGHTVTVEGTLETTDAFKATTGKDGAISQGSAGGDAVLRSCKRVP